LDALTDIRADAAARTGVPLLKLRYMAVTSLLHLVALSPPLWLLWTIGGELLGAFCIPVGIPVAWMLFRLLAMIDRRPLLVVEPQGVRLPCAGGAFFAAADIDAVWVEEVGTRRNRSRFLCIQFRPRSHIDLSLWAWLRGVRANTLLQGDICFDEALVDAGAGGVAGLMGQKLGVPVGL